jgi:hypothetical protein
MLRSKHLSEIFLIAVQYIEAHGIESDIFIIIVSRDSVVGIATGYGLDD